jgi:hypothetical protein
MAAFAGGSRTPKLYVAEGVGRHELSIGKNALLIDLLARIISMNC